VSGKGRERTKGTGWQGGYERGGNRGNEGWEGLYSFSKGVMDPSRKCINNETLLVVSVMIGNRSLAQLAGDATRLVFVDNTDGGVHHVKVGGLL